MNSTTIDPCIPIKAAAHLETYGWIPGWGEYGPGTHGKTCGHGAVLSVCGEHSGDQYLWRRILDLRGLTTGDNDGSTQDSVVGKLKSFAEPTPEEMESAFGPQWREVRTIVRTTAAATPDQIYRLKSARSAAEAWAEAAEAARAWAWAESRAWAAAAAAWAAEAEARAWAWAEEAAAAEAEAAEAARAVCVRHLVGQLGLTQQHIDTLLGPWIEVFGDPREVCHS